MHIFFEKQARQGFCSPSAMGGFFGKFFWTFLGFFWRIFFAVFFGGFFLEDTLPGILRLKSAKLFESEREFSILRSASKCISHLKMVKFEKKIIVLLDM